MQTLGGLLHNLAEAYSKDGKVDDAVKTYQQAATADPTHAAQYYYNEERFSPTPEKAMTAIGRLR